MDEGLLREISKDYLLPFFSGALIEDAASPSNQYHELVALRDHLSLFFKVSRLNSYRLALFRSQSFVTQASRIIPERDVVSAFVSVLGEMEAEVAGPLKQDLLSTFQRRVVARALYNGRHEDTILAGITTARWANRLYEGSPISASIGFRQTTQAGALNMSELSRLDLGAVLSNGFDTLLSFGFHGRFLGHESLEGGDMLPSYCPMRQSQIADGQQRSIRDLPFRLID